MRQFFFPLFFTPKLLRGWNDNLIFFNLNNQYRHLLKNLKKSWTRKNLIKFVQNMAGNKLLPATLTITGKNLKKKRGGEGGAEEMKQWDTTIWNIYEPLRKAFWASFVIASASSSMTSLKPLLKMVRVLAKLNTAPRTTSMPRSSDAFNWRVKIKYVTSYVNLTTVRYSRRCKIFCHPSKIYLFFHSCVTNWQVAKR